MDIDAADRVVLIRISRLYRDGMIGAPLYKATRKWWVLNPGRHPDWALAVADGIVHAAYRIDDWEQDATSARWAFRGSPDPVMEAKYVGADVSGYFPRGAANPIRYINC